MSAASRSHFVYVTLIRTTPAKLWEALTDPAFVRQYWFGVTVECAWTKGSPCKTCVPRNGRPGDEGEILRSTHRGEWLSAGRMNGTPSSKLRGRAAAPSNSSRQAAPSNSPSLTKGSSSGRTQVHPRRQRRLAQGPLEFEVAA